MSLIAKAKESLIAAAKEANPVTVEEFVDIMENLYRHQTMPKRLAIGVSGGVDSMALAFLCSQYAKRKPSLQIFPFTVDHSLRSESASEALLVSRNLEEIGLKNSQILRINWINDQSKKTEERSRTQRYLLLAQAMRQHRTPACLLAHSQDENVETFVLRLLTGSGSVGLACMRGLAPIPVQNVFGSEHMHVARPLLSIPKARLVATCLANNVTWYEDLTNHYATYAERNAIRFMYSTPENLPKALQKSNINKAIETLDIRRTKSDDIAQRYINQDFSSGKIILNVSIGSIQFTPSARLLELSPVSFIRYLYLMIRRITPIADHSNIVSRLNGIAEKIRDYLAHTQDSSQKPIKTTSYDLVWTNRPDEAGRIDSAGLRISKSSRYKMNFKKKSNLKEAPQKQFTVYRQPYLHGTRPVSDIEVRLDSNNKASTDEDNDDITGIPSMNTRQATTVSEAESPSENFSDKSRWTLWDGRFWVRLWIGWSRKTKSSDNQVLKGNLKVRLRSLDYDRDQKFLRAQYQTSSREVLKESKDVLLLPRHYAFRQLQFLELIPAHARDTMMVVADPETNNFLSLITMGSEPHLALPTSMLKTIAPDSTQFRATLYWQTQLKHFNVYA